MITFESRNKVIRNADLITRKAASQYPHVSSSRITNFLDNDKVWSMFFENVEYKYMLKVGAERFKMEEAGKDLYSAIISSLREAKVGNCYEDAKFAELIGRINGQKNIYSGKLYVGDGLFQKEKMLNHEVAFITDKTMFKDTKYSFRKKEAIILDPWLGITDYAGEYFNKLKTIYNHIFPTQPDDSTYTRYMRNDKRNVETFKKFRKMRKPKVAFKIEPDFSCKLSPQKLRRMKKENQELVIKNYEPISFKGYSEALRYAK